jgi:hypothetical protein
MMPRREIMEINSLQGAAAYINASSANSPVDNTQVRDQNIEASRTDLDTRSTTTAQEAFEVTITQEARNLQAEAATEQTTAVAPPEGPPAQPAETPSNNTVVQASQASQIVNIVA